MGALTDERKARLTQRWARSLKKRTHWRNICAEAAECAQSCERRSCRVVLRADSMMGRSCEGAKRGGHCVRWTKCPRMDGMTPTQFRHLLAEAGLNQTQAAAVLEVTDRTLRRYVSGNSPVPKMAIWTILRYIELQQDRGSKS